MVITFAEAAIYVENYFMKLKKFNDTELLIT